MAECYVMILDTANQPLTGYYPARITMPSEPSPHVTQFLNNLSEVAIDFQFADDHLLDLCGLEPQDMIRRNIIIKTERGATNYNAIHGAWLVSYAYGDSLYESVDVETKWIFRGSVVVLNGEEIPVNMRRIPLVTNREVSDWNGPTIRFRPEPINWSQEGF